MKHTAINYALWLLGRRDRTIAEIKEKLLKKEYPKEEIDQTVSFLTEKKFLDDKRFAKYYIKNQLSIKPLGKYQLRMKLKKKLVPNDIIEEALAEDESDESELTELAYHRWNKNNFQKDKKYDKVCRHLLSRGFDWETVKQTLEKHKQEIST